MEWISVSCDWCKQSGSTELKGKRETFGNSGNQYSKTGQLRSLVLVCIMVQNIRHNAIWKAAVTEWETGNKYPMPTNENISICLFKEAILKILLEPKEKKFIPKLNELLEEMEYFVLPIRKLSGKEYRKNISNKYKNNQKSSYFKSP